MPSQVVQRLRILVGCVPEVAWFSRTRRVRLHGAREIDEWLLIPDYPVVIGRSFGIGTGLLVQGLLAVFTLPTVLQAEITNVVVLKEAEGSIVVVVFEVDEVDEVDDDDDDEACSMNNCWIDVALSPCAQSAEASTEYTCPF